MSVPIEPVEPQPDGTAQLIAWRDSDSLDTKLIGRGAWAVPDIEY